MPGAPKCRACGVRSSSSFASTSAYCKAVRSDALPHWLAPSDLAGEVRRALVRKSGRPYAGHPELVQGRAGLSTPAIRETYRRMVSVTPASTPAKQRAELAYHLKRWSSQPECHPSLTDADRGD